MFPYYSVCPVVCQADGGLLNSCMLPNICHTVKIVYCGRRGVLKCGRLRGMGAPTEQNWREARRRRAWEMHETGWKQKDIAEALGVTKGAVS
jgi:hypothetical protein